MSMNLCFSTKVGGHYIEFPFQSPTDMTWAVLKFTEPKEQCEELYRQLKQYGWDGWEELYEECEAMIMSPTLELCYI